MATPIRHANGWALWFSRDDNGFYWQDRDGAGDNTSKVYKTEAQAVLAMRRGKIVAAKAKAGAT